MGVVEMEKDDDLPFSETIIRFRTVRGRMAIRMAAFFPCDKARLLKVVKIMREGDNRHEDLEEIRRALITELEERIQGNEQALPGHAKGYFENKQKSADLNRQLTEGKYPNGLPIPKEVRKELRKMQRTAAAVASSHKIYFDRKQKLIRDLKKNLEVIKAVEL